MTRDRVINEYFEWLYNSVCDKKSLRGKSYKKLFMFLHNTEFRYSIPMDENRAIDGLDLRYRFALNGDYGFITDSLDGPCSVLEMMIALAIRCEEHIMDDPDIGDRTGKWFWDMIDNLGLISMSDSRFDRRYVNEQVSIFLDREYEPNGNGGLFTVKNSGYDLRYVEIWYQMCWYLDSIL